MNRKILSIILALALCLSLIPTLAFAAEEPVTVTVFTTNDLHGVVEGSGAIGVVQTAAIKASTPNALLVDAGDTTQGASFATISQGEDVIRMMNAAANEVQAVLDAVKTAQKDVLGQFLCINELPLWGGNIYWDYSESRIVEISYGDFVTDAFAASAGIFARQNGLELPVIALENGGVSYALPMGKVTRGDVLNAFNHGNMVEVLEITPAQLYAVLESGLGNITGQDETGLLLREKVSGSFMQVSGFAYAYDPAAESGMKVSTVKLDNGTELARTDDRTALLVVTNS